MQILLFSDLEHTRLLFLVGHETISKEIQLYFGIHSHIDLSAMVFTKTYR